MTHAIRPARPDETARAEAFFPSLDPETRIFLLRRPETGIIRYLISEDGGEIVGAARLAGMETRLPRLVVAVRKTYRDRGLGTALVDFALAYARNAGCGGVLFFNYAANIRGTALANKTRFQNTGVWKEGGFVYLRAFDARALPAEPYIGEAGVARPFAAGDLARVNDFFDVMGPESRAFFNQMDGQRAHAVGWFDPAKKDNYVNTRLWLTEGEQGEMTGFVFLWRAHQGVPTLGIGVRENCKGKHLGRALIACAVDYAERNGCGAVELTTHPANLRGQRLYEHMGFQCVGTQATELLYYLPIKA